MIPQDDLRIGDAERDVTMESLREHYAQGRLTREELDERLELALSARTGGELARVSADLPGPRDSRQQESEAPWGPGPPWGPGGAPWGPRRGHHGHAPSWGPPQRGGRRHHPGWSHHHMGHHGGPPLFLLMFPVLVAGMLIGGFGALKFVFLAWLVMAVLRMLHRGRGRPRTRYGRVGPPASS